MCWDSGESCRAFGLRLRFSQKCKQPCRDPRKFAIAIPSSPVAADFQDSYKRRVSPGGEALSLVALRIRLKAKQTEKSLRQDVGEFGLNALRAPVQVIGSSFSVTAERVLRDTSLV